ncbi:nucleotidyltransferase/DNA polymerase involved in DNA repair [Desulfitispora alkaliphila]
MTQVIMLADMESFYASVEISRNPHLKEKPVIVCGDPKLRHGIALAASRQAKEKGIKTGMPAWECTALCPDAIFVSPHMQTYIDVSLEITKILEQYTDLVMPYSIDEQFLDVTGSQKLYGEPEKIAHTINREILCRTGVRCRIGIGENPLQAKMACDNFAKKNRSGIFSLSKKSYYSYVWPLPIKKLFGVGSRMEKN